MQQLQKSSSNVGQPIQFKTRVIVSDRVRPDSAQAHTIHRDGQPKSWWKRLALGTGLVTLLAAGALSATSYQRYSNQTLSDISLMTEAVDGHQWVGQDISFQQVSGNQFDVHFALDGGGLPSDLRLQNIDLSLMIPEVPMMAQGDATLTQWFLTEREFNRQRVIFEAGSAHIDLPNGFAGYAAEDISISLTNNCLGAGYWELAVFAQTETGAEKIYQGYFTFPRGAYANLVAQLNPTNYWQQARTMEAWPGFRFLSGRAMDLAQLRTVQQEQSVPVNDLQAETIFAAGEQVKKADLMVYAEGQDASQINTWQDLRQADLKFQSFTTPGIYDPSRLWESDYSQLATVTGGTARQIESPLSDQRLHEVQINFENESGEQRNLIVSGLDLAQIPQLDTQDYSDGIYMPMGFGTPFTQNYSDLVNNPPAESPFFSMLLDRNDQVIDYRKDIGINGLVMHRDANDANRLHLYIMSYERITLVGHYVIDLTDV